MQIAMSKREELAATEPQVLAGVGQYFTGFREALAISDRALHDVSSALKEVAGVVSGSEGVTIVDVLDENLRIRKECNDEVKERLSRIEKGKDKMKDTECKGLRDFFLECAMKKDKS